MSASCGLASGVGRRRWIFVDTLNILATFGYYLASFLASVYLLVSHPKKRQIFGLLLVLQIEKMNTQIKNGHFVMCIRVSVQINHLFCKTNTQKTVAKVNNLCTEKNRVLCICISVYWGKEITA